MSDFGEGDWTFSRQHDVRLRDQNATHSVISILDNARGLDTQEPTYRLSRGLLLAVDEESMTVTILQQLDHPDGNDHYAPRRGNHQRLPGGNVFMGWSEDGIQSEHGPDGTILMHARLTAEWLGSYRNYKFADFTGRPSEKPAVHSVAYTTHLGSSATVAHVSWNGATEVASWNMYKTTKDDDIRILVGSTERTGFESVVQHSGLASFVLFEAIGKNGETLGVSEVTRTNSSTNITGEALAAESNWIAAVSEGRHRPFFEHRMFVFFLGAITGAITAAGLWALWRRGPLARVSVPKWFHDQLVELKVRDKEIFPRRKGKSQLEEDPGGMDEPLHSKYRSSSDSLDSEFDA